VDVLDGVTDAVLVGRPQVAVGVEGFGGVGVPERRLDRFDAAPGGDQHRREMVPQVVERNTVRQAAAVRALRMASPNAVRRHGSPRLVVKTSPSSPDGYWARWAANTSSVTAANGTVRCDAFVFGGPNCGSLPGQVDHLPVDMNLAPAENRPGRL
jgi:hypothetical protein